MVWVSNGSGVHLRENQRCDWPREGEWRGGGFGRRFSLFRFLDADGGKESVCMRVCVCVRCDTQKGSSGATRRGAVRIKGSKADGGVTFPLT